MHLFNEERELQDNGKIDIPRIGELPIEEKLFESNININQQINIDPSLPEDILNDIKSEGKINSSYLQLVMERQIGRAHV